MTFKKQLNKALLKEGISHLDIPVGLLLDYEGLTDTNLIPKIVENIKEGIVELEQTPKIEPYKEYKVI
ncbi:hypothetical protein [Romboutsia lituseburensis]|uniref:hypothetical protein n=1 Tax=Romboutsia lituseburensis TaxID=1537 RepID=UPI00215A290E|nr:hypothetical protein [Romboutsia lituseburensis]MCR8745239.1 hypothetical protein [Romboutsia lituseburensis]